MIYKKLNERLYIKALIIISISILNNCNVNKRKEMFDCCCCCYLCCKCCKKNEVVEKQNVKIETLNIKTTPNSNNNNKLNIIKTSPSYDSSPSSLNYPEVQNKQNSIIINSNEKSMPIKKTSTPIPIPNNNDSKRSSTAIIHEYDYKPRAIYISDNEDCDQNNKNKKSLKYKKIIK